MISHKRDWIIIVPSWATMERNTARFMAAGENGVDPTRLMPQESKGWKPVWRNEEPVCCRLHQPGPCLTPRNGTTMSPLAPCHPAWGWLQFCLRQLCWLICQACVPLDWLWNGPKPGASLNHEEILSLLTLWSQSLMGGLLRFFFSFLF